MARFVWLRAARGGWRRDAALKNCAENDDEAALALAYRGNDHQSLPVCKVQQVALAFATAVAIQSLIADTMLNICVVERVSPAHQGLTRPSRGTYAALRSSRCRKSSVSWETC